MGPDGPHWHPRSPIQLRFEQELPASLKADYPDSKILRNPIFSDIPRYKINTYFQKKKELNQTGFQIDSKTNMGFHKDRIFNA